MKAIVIVDKMASCMFHIGYVECFSLQRLLALTVNCTLYHCYLVTIICASFMIGMYFSVKKKKVGNLDVLFEFVPF